MTPYSSPKTPSPGRSASSIARIARSVARSASVTWDRVGLRADLEIRGIEAAHGCRIRRIRQPQRELEIGAEIPLERRIERRRGEGEVTRPRISGARRPRFPGDAIVMLMLTLGSPRWRITHL